VLGVSIRVRAVLFNPRVVTQKWVAVWFGWVADYSSLHLQKLYHFYCDLMLVIACGIPFFLKNLLSWI